MSSRQWDSTIFNDAEEVGNWGNQIESMQCTSDLAPRAWIIDKDVLQLFHWNPKSQTIKKFLESLYMWLKWFQWVVKAMICNVQLQNWDSAMHMETTTVKIIHYLEITKVIFHGKSVGGCIPHSLCASRFMYISQSTTLISEFLCSYIMTVLF